MENFTVYIYEREDSEKPIKVLEFSSPVYADEVADAFEELTDYYVHRGWVL